MKGTVIVDVPKSWIEREHQSDEGYSRCEAMRDRVFARFEGIAGTQVTPGWRGYEHMDCCMLFVITQVLSFDPKSESMK